jgi:hypothetical protein
MYREDVLQCLYGVQIVMACTQFQHLFAYLFPILFHACFSCVLLEMLRTISQLQLHNSVMHLKGHSDEKNGNQFQLTNA